ncbi:hypothetical protein DY000_02006194 [Brassica cretica]|uniref:Uncharacterized protein n=1 Tax=Brassica cretica TaxID=69181 RepID=A0ABQ7C0I5_BRACR|nr:hypothetical protein DY000_02006194 [Brassica cretica]
MNFDSRKHGLSLLRSSGDSIRRFDENAWIDVCRCSEEFNRYTATELRLEPGRYRPSGTIARLLRSDRALARARSLRSDQALARARLLRSDRALAQARSLRIDRAGRALGRYVATEPWLELGRYVVTERDDRSVAT